MIWVGPKHKTYKPKKDKSHGWHVILIPKGQAYDKEKRDEYELEPVDNSDLQTVIAIANQESNVIVENESNVQKDAAEFFEDFFPDKQYLGKWENYPDYDDTK